MGTLPHASHSRWTRANYFLSVLAMASGGLVVGFRWWWGPVVSLVGSLLALPLAYWVIVRTSLYRRIYRGKPMAMIGFVIGFLGFSDAVGHIAYHSLWRRAFRMNGPSAIFENKSEGWRIRYPGQWKAYSMKGEGVSTFFFKPERSTPAIEFSLSHRNGVENPNLESAVQDFLLALPKTGDTQILFQGEIPYPLYQHARQVIYEDPSQSIPLRHRLIFLSHAEGLTVLSVAITPSWYERLAKDSERFLFSFEPLG